MASPRLGSACRSQSVAAAPTPGRRCASFDAGAADAEGPAARAAALPRRNSRLSSLATAVLFEPTQHRTKRCPATPGFRLVELTSAIRKSKFLPRSRLVVSGRANLTLTRESGSKASFAARSADLCDTLS